MAPADLRKEGSSFDLPLAMALLAADEKIDGTNLALVTDAKAGKYFVLNLDTKKIISSNPVATPVTSMVVLKKVKKIGGK